MAVQVSSPTLLVPRQLGGLGQKASPASIPHQLAKHQGPTHWGLAKNPNESTANRTRHTISGRVHTGIDPDIYAEGLAY